VSDRGAPDGAGADAGAPAFKGAPLGDQCPPADSIPPDDALFIRLVPTDTPAADDFRSCHLEGKIPGRKCDPCLWRAVSFFLEHTPPEDLADLAKLRNHTDKKFKAFVRVGPDSGRIKISPNGTHVSFWMYETFSPEIAVERIQAI